MRDYSLFSKDFPGKIDEKAFIKDFFKCLAKKLGVPGDTHVCNYSIYSRVEEPCCHYSHDCDDDDCSGLFDDFEDDCDFTDCYNPDDFGDDKPAIIVVALMQSEKGYFVISSVSSKVDGYFDMAYPLSLFYNIELPYELIEALESKELHDKIYLNQFCKALPGFWVQMSFSDAFLVQKDRLYGIVGRMGQTLIPVKYKEIKPFGFEKTCEPLNEEHGGDERQYIKTDLYVCKNGFCDYDVYDLNGNMIFEHIGDIYPYKEEITHPKIWSEADEVQPSTVTVTDIYVQMMKSEPPYDDYICDYYFEYNVDELFKSIKIFKSEMAPVQLNVIDNKKSDYEFALCFLFSNDIYKSKTLINILYDFAEVISQVTGEDVGSILKKLPNYGDLC